MRNRCSNCMFCKKSIVSDYIKDAEIYKCDLDNDVVLNPRHEGKDCTWFRVNPHIRWWNWIVDFFCDNTNDN